MYTCASCCQQSFLSQATASAKQIMLPMIRYYDFTVYTVLYSSAVKKTKKTNPSIYRTDARGAACDPAAVTTQPRSIGKKRPRRGSCPFPWLAAFILKTPGRFHYDKTVVSQREKWERVQQQTYSPAFQDRTFVFILEEEQAIIKL